MKKIILLAFAVMLATTPVLAGVTIGSYGFMPTLGMQFNENLSGRLGATYVTTAGAGTTNYLVNLEYNLAKAGEVQSSMGIYYANSSAAGATATFGLTYGVVANLATNLALGADFVLVSSTGTTTGILSNGTGGVGVIVKSTYTL